MPSTRRRLGLTPCDRPYRHFRAINPRAGLRCSYKWPSHVRSQVNRTLSRHRRMTECDPLRKRRLMTRRCGSERPAHEATSGSPEPNRPATELDAVKRRAPALAGQDWKGARQGAGGDDVAGCQRRIDRIAREQGDEMAQRRQRAVEDVGAMAAIDHGAIAQQIDLKTCGIGNPIGGAAEARRMAWREQQCAVQARSISSITPWGVIERLAPVGA